MSGNTLQTQRLITSSQGLKSVVRTMKAMAAVSIGPYERALRSLDTYRRTIELAMTGVFRQLDPLSRNRLSRRNPGLDIVIAFGSDQGMVGAFNERLARTIIDGLAADAAASPDRSANLPTCLWTVGERLHHRLDKATDRVIGPCPVPESVEAIPSLMSRLLVEVEREQGVREISSLTLYFNRPALGAGFEPTKRRILPLDPSWLSDLATKPWPTKFVPQAVGGGSGILAVVIREHLFLSLFEACARSGASEHATRLAAMMRAEKSIDERVESLQREYHTERQNAIMDELFDVIAGSGEPSHI